jgi:hypothetical protein
MEGDDPAGRAALEWRLPPVNYLISNRLPRWSAPKVEELDDAPAPFSPADRTAAYGPGWNGWAIGRRAGGRAAYNTSLQCDLYRLHIQREDAEQPQCALGGNEQSLAESGLVDAVAEDGEGRHLRGFQIYQHRDTLRDRRSKRNFDKEYRMRAKLREAARHDPDAFRSAIPGDILDRVMVADADDVPNGSSIRHPRLVPSWNDAPGDGRFTAPPRVKQSVSPALAIGDAEIAAEIEVNGDIPVVNLHGVKIGLRRSDRKPPELGNVIEVAPPPGDDAEPLIISIAPVWSVPYQPKSGAARPLTGLETLAWQAVNWMFTESLADEPDPDFSIRDLIVDLLMAA